MNFDWNTTFVEDVYKEERKTATALHHELKIKEMYTEAELTRMKAEYRHEQQEEERRKAPQIAMDSFLGGVSYEDVLALVKQNYPEKFI